MKKIFFLILLLGALGQVVAQTGFLVANGTHVNLNNGVALLLDQMDFEMNGTFSDGNNSTVKFSGHSNRGIYAIAPVSFYNLEINKSSGAKILLQEDILVENELTLSQGQLDLNGFVLGLEGGQIIGEDATNYISGNAGGYIEIIQVLDNPDQVNPGNIGVQITSIENMGSTTIRRGHEEQSSNDGGSSILRYFDISPTNNTGLNATFRMYYNQNELNGIPESELESWRSTDDGNTWTLIEGSILNTNNNWVQLSGVDAFSRWTLASETTNPLPVELIDFSGEALDDFNTLSWQTLSEHNADYFELQRLDNNLWTPLGRVAATGFSNSIQAYSFSDVAPGYEEYYRLKMVDLDGTIDFSKIINVKRRGELNTLFTIFPNPANDYISITGADLETVTIYDPTGKFIKSFGEDFDALNISDLSSGVYWLELKFGQQFILKRLTKI